MKTLQVDDTTYSMMLDLVKKHSLSTKALVDKLVYPLHSQMKRTGEGAVKRNKQLLVVRKDLIEITTTALKVLKKHNKELVEQDRELKNEISRFRWTNTV